MKIMTYYLTHLKYLKKNPIILTYDGILRYMLNSTNEVFDWKIFTNYKIKLTYLQYEILKNI